MQAAADSSITKMSELWGTAKGSAARTGQPKDYSRRMVIMQAYLTGVAVRTLGEVRTGKSDRMLVTTELSRGPCKVTLPVTAIKAGKGWIVNQFDLSLASEVKSRVRDRVSGEPGQLTRRCSTDAWGTGAFVLCAFGEFDQDAVCRLRMDKRDPAANRRRAGRFIDQR